MLGYSLSCCPALPCPVQLPCPALPCPAALPCCPALLPCLPEASALASAKRLACLDAKPFEIHYVHAAQLQETAFVAASIHSCSSVQCLLCEHDDNQARLVQGW